MNLNSQVKDLCVYIKFSVPHGLALLIIKNENGENIFRRRSKSVALTGLANYFIKI